jgi:hypothetical protein
MISPAHASDSDAVSACKKAVEVFQAAAKVEFKTVQDFSNLKPPRVTLVDETLASTTYRCSFTSAIKPVSITKFCIPPLGCYKAGDERFDEIKEMLRRDGY